MRSHRYSVDNARYCVLLAHNSQVLVVGLVILDSSRSLFDEGGWIAALTQVPRFLAVAPGADLGRETKVDPIVKTIFCPQ